MPITIKLDMVEGGVFFEDGDQLFINLSLFTVWSNLSKTSDPTMPSSDSPTSDSTLVTLYHAAIQLSSIAI